MATASKGERVPADSGPARRWSTGWTCGKRAPNARQLLNLLYRKPVIWTGTGIALSVSTPTANALVRELKRLGILAEISGQERGRVYAFDRYLRLFVS